MIFFFQQLTNPLAGASSGALSKTFQLTFTMYFLKLHTREEWVEVIQEIILQKRSVVLKEVCGLPLLSFWRKQIPG